MFKWFSILFAKSVKESWTTVPMIDEDFEFVNQNPKLQFKFIDRPLCDDVIRYIDGKHESPVEGFYLNKQPRRILRFDSLNESLVRRDFR